ncbi:GntR family transcriptional regulator [Thioalkalivibrio denitrificans]|uniref:GntR family transcriptional regulator n=1 Tax=Thioalkalivibrio denitrificans TaxID=108003 RepID=A0A1V3NRE4_9GAMM|nr:GntR family transcriptional regulator [Thioalkalivibrio denitrificans]OOG27685.1 GntR family transcriptional regulator [Thioalkalivibrio denitrificans]
MNGTISAADIGRGPLYKRVKSLLTQSLADGEWKPNEAIPSESRLAERFDVSIGTVRKAIDELTAERILVRQQGRGTFVAAHTQSRFLYHFYHVVDEDGIKRFPTPELLQFRRIRAEQNVATRLGLDKGARVIHARNLLRIEGYPVEVNDIYVDAEVFEGLDRDTFSNRPGTIYQLYQERFGLNIIRTSEQLRAVAVDESEANLLDIEVNAPVLQVDRIAFTYHSKPVEYRRSLVNTSRHVYQSDQEATG